MSTTVGKAERNIQVKKRDVTAAACILMLALMLGVLEGNVSIALPVQTESLGTFKVTTYVPFFVLYDPPGDESYSLCNVSFCNITMEFQGHSSEFDAVGEFSRQLGLYFGTRMHSAVRSNSIGALQMNQTWEVDRYSSLGREWTQANLRNCTPTGGWGVVGFKDCSHYGMWVKDMTNTTSDYSADFNVGAGSNKSVSLDCLLDTPQPINAGYNITLMGVDVGISVLISCQGNPVTVSYMFEDTTAPLSIHLFSTTPIQQDPYSTEGALLWCG